MRPPPLLPMSSMLARIVRGPSCRPIATCSVLYKGHSHWDNIQHVKGRKDMAKSLKINKWVSSIQKLIAQTNNNVDLTSNVALAKLVDSALKDAVPKATIDRQLERSKTIKLAAERYYMLGPNNCFVIMDAIVERRGLGQQLINRALRKLGGFREAGDDLRLSFEEKGLVYAVKEGVTLDAAEEIAIECEADDVEMIEDEEEPAGSFVLTCAPNSVAHVEAALLEHECRVVRTDVDLVPFTRTKLQAAQLETVGKFYEMILSNDEFDRVYDNVEWPNE